MSEPFIGQIIMFGGNFAPRSWAFCNGQLLAISQNSALFSILGTTYGGDGRTTFGLPEMRGRVAVHAGNGPGLSNRNLGQRSGSETNTQTIATMANHGHTATTTIHAVDDDSTTEEAAGASLANASTNMYSPGTVDTTLKAGAATTANASTGGQQQINNMQPYMTVNYIIALFGTFPSRS